MWNELRTISYKPRHNDDSVFYWVFGIIGIITISFLIICNIDPKTAVNLRHEQIKKECSLIRHEEGKYIHTYSETIWIPGQSCYMCKNHVEECINGEVYK